MDQQTLDSFGQELQHRRADILARMVSLYSKALDEVPPLGQPTPEEE
jgi:hypothetical protein